MHLDMILTSKTTARHTGLIWCRVVHVKNGIVHIGELCTVVASFRKYHAIAIKKTATNVLAFAVLAALAL